MAIAQRIAPCLWFDSEGEDAAKFYVGIFPNSRITQRRAATARRARRSTGAPRDR